jgi:glycosyltransferase involved in cell wall biosynthesis
MVCELKERWPRVKLLIAGEGDERTRLEAGIQRHNLYENVSLLGQRSDIPELLQLADVFVFPSDNEALGLAVTEAMAAAKPVVASALPALAEVVDDGINGYLVEPGNPAAFAQGVTKILNSAGRGIEMGKKGREIVAQKFNIHRNVKTLEALYLDVLMSRSSERRRP